MRSAIPGSMKRGEPYDRLQGATNLQRGARSKPLKSGGTTRAEHARWLVATATKGQQAPVLRLERANREWTRTSSVGGRVSLTVWRS